MSVLGLMLPSVAHAYGWPVKPFNRMHAIRGTFDDPRFHVAPDLTWKGTFHFGVDISAPDGTPVYAVEPGIAVRGPDSVSLRRPNRRPKPNRPRRCHYQRERSHRWSLAHPQGIWRRRPNSSRPRPASRT